MKTNIDLKFKNQENFFKSKHQLIWAAAPRLQTYCCHGNINVLRTCRVASESDDIDNVSQDVPDCSLRRTASFSEAGDPEITLEELQEEPGTLKVLHS